MDPVIVFSFLVILVIAFMVVAKAIKSPPNNHLLHIREKLSSAGYNNNKVPPMEAIEDVLTYIDKNV